MVIIDEITKKIHHFESFCLIFGRSLFIRNCVHYTFSFDNNSKVFHLDDFLAFSEFSLTNEQIFVFSKFGN
jgi:hypothetical protein